LAAVLEECTIEEQRSIVRFLWEKESHKAMYPVCGGKCLSRKALHNWVEKRGKRFADDEEVETEVRKWQRTAKRRLCCGFRRTDKAMGQVYQCWWRICREISVYPRLKYHVFYVLYPFVTYLLSLPSSFQ
jgi:hypothetical protein